MSFNGGVITAPVSIADVQEALGDGRNDLGALCRSDNILPWAKYKPIYCRMNGTSGSMILGVLTDAKRALVNYGMINIPTWGTAKNLGHVINFWVNGDTTSTNLPVCGVQDKYWTNSLPTDVYRLTDFVCGENPKIGYFTGAREPIGAVKEVVKSGSQVTVVFNMELGGIYYGHTLWYSDFTTMTNVAGSNVSFQNLYFGIVMVAGQHKYLATQSNAVGGKNTDTGTLWSMGAHVRFKLGENSGDLKTYIDNNMPIKVFPIMVPQSARNYVENTVITPATPANISGPFVAIHETEEIIIPGVFTVIPDIYLFSAWKDNTNNARKNLRICYVLRINTNDDPNTHYINIRIVALDADGNQVGNDKQVLNATTPYFAPVDEPNYGYTSAFIDINASTLGVQYLKVEVTKGSSDTSAQFSPRDKTVPVEKYNPDVED